MVHLLLSRASRVLSSRSFFVLWTRVSAAMLLLQGLFGSMQSSIAKLGVALILLILLASGTVLIALAIKDLIRDLVHTLRSH